MARSISLLQARKDIRERANNQRATDTTVDRAFNQYIAELWGILLQVHGDQYGKSPEPITITTSPNLSQYPVDDDVLKVLGVWWERGQNDHVEVLPYEQNRARGPARVFGWDRFNGAVYYRLEGTVFRFQPMPLGVHTVLIDYIPPAVQLVEETDTFDGYNGYELYPIYRAAAEISRDESEFELSDRLNAQAAEIRATIEKQSDRDQANAPRIALRRSREWRTAYRDEEEDSFR